MRGEKMNAEKGEIGVMNNRGEEIWEEARNRDRTGGEDRATGAGCKQVNNNLMIILDSSASVAPLSASGPMITWILLEPNKEINEY